MSLDRLIIMYTRTYLTSEWYQKQRSRFEQEPTYNSTKDILERQIDLAYKELTFEEYAWYDEHRELTEPLPDENEKAHRDPIDASLAARWIINSVGQMLPSGDVTTSYKAIKVSETYIKEAIDKLKATTIIDQNFLDFFEARVIMDMWSSNSWLIKLHEISGSDEKVDFVINQEELAALLYLISECFLAKEDQKVSKITKMHFYSFCTKHFTCRTKGTVTSISELPKRISDVRKGNKIEPMKYVFNRLKKKFDDTP